MNTLTLLVQSLRHEKSGCSLEEDEWKRGKVASQNAALNSPAPAPPKAAE
jgi:hypothetical protein